MALIRIQGGCSLSNTYDGLHHWTYQVSDNTGFHSYQFVSNIAPKIGDQIDTSNGTLVVNTEDLTNNDPGFQAKKVNDRTWPENFKGY